MEIETFKIFYAGIDAGGYPKEGQRLKKTGLPILKVTREFPYLLGRMKKQTGKMQVYYSILPEYCGKTFLSGKPRSWKKETAKELIEEARKKAAIRWDCQEEIFSPEIVPFDFRMPLELMAVCLYRYRPFDRLCLSLPEEGGKSGVEQAVKLLTPYLPRMRQVMYAGGESAESKLLEEYLYKEYGILMTGIEKIPSNMIWLDWREEAATVFPSGQKYINPARMLNFLDTAVKNGYNTDVNS